jgi:catechol 2,3-dioxygenase-like lactoylglutathione lyase family enzyme
LSAFDRTTQDVGNILSLDHLNLTVPDQQAASAFYIVGLGLTRDPYLTVGLENMWVNAGRQQFHLPTRPQAQVVRGRIGLVVPSRPQLEERLARIAPTLEGTRFAFREHHGHLDVTCPWGNEFVVNEATADLYGGTVLGMPWLELDVPAGTAEGIARFYTEVMGASASVGTVRRNPAALVPMGRGQHIAFRESEGEVPAYDGHHIAVYLADFSGPHARLAERGLVSEESSAVQYRFVDIVDPDSGAVLTRLEHEVRSMHHPMYARPLVNRNASVDQRSYTRGADALTLG